jgi:GT2 family glycosyltransferase
MIGVTAVVLTFDARENINRCIAAINAQTLKPRSILVVEIRARRCCPISPA